MNLMRTQSERRSEEKITMRAAKLEKNVTAEAPYISEAPSVARVEVSNLTVRFPVYGQQSQPVLNKISLEVAPGEILGLVGESGSGKTTLARAMMGMIPQPGVLEDGEIKLDDINIYKLTERELRALRGPGISMMVPNPRSELNPLETVGNQIANVAYEHLGCSWQEAVKKAKEMLNAVRIPDVERRFKAYPHELSGGMAQRVIIAIALICSPRLVISDDATSGLDVTVQAQVLKLMTALVTERRSSMLFITRDIGVAAHFCNRIAVIYAGEIVETADVGTFFRRPTHPYSVILLAAFSHNPALRKMWMKENSEGGSRAIARTGCTFRNRCVRAQERCAVETPMLRKQANGSETRCHFPVGV